MAWNALTQMQPLMRAAGMRELDERGSDLALARAASQRVADALLRGAGDAALPDVVIAPNWFGDTSRSLIAHHNLSPLSAHAFASTLLALPLTRPRRVCRAGTRVVRLTGAAGGSARTSVSRGAGGSTRSQTRCGSWRPSKPPRPPQFCRCCGAMRMGTGTAAAAAAAAGCCLSRTCGESSATGPTGARCSAQRRELCCRRAAG